MARFLLVLFALVPSVSVARDLLEGTWLTQPVSDLSDTSQALFVVGLTVGTFVSILVVVWRLTVKFFREVDKVGPGI